MVFDNRVALVTGAGSGLGEASAKTLAARGASVVVADLSEEQGLRVVDDIRRSGGRAEFVSVNVAEEDEVNAAVAFAVETFGALHLAHNNAGITHWPSPLEELDTPAWDRVLAVNLTGVFYCMRAEIAHMVANGGGAIVNTASFAGLKAAPGMYAYTAAKHGVVGLTRSAGLDYARQGIRINAVAPGSVATPIWSGMNTEAMEHMASVLPPGRFGQPQEVADAVAFLLSDEASYIMGETLSIDGAALQSSAG